MKIVLLVALGLMLAACTAPVLLRHTQTGQTVQCGRYYYSGMHSRAAAEREIQCVQDYQRQGYERAPE